ncbi:MAG TPA: tyrosine--tRNA ligase [Bacteroidales bacterium]|nr:tyrosine--tRNA ligase [Bacteroidales bacterium]HQH13600.1 tyrosine--tRNA ligase [Bacteroidales bacterium]
MNFIEELQWRGMIHDMTPGLTEQLENEMTTAYVGIDPTADSLHIGHLVSVMMLKHFQVCGHRPIVLIGGATGMIGDPSGKSKERNLLDEQTLQQNQESIKNQLSKFLDFNQNKPNGALMVNNYDWMKEYSFLQFIRDIGKHITVNYMMAKDSVKTRLSAESKEGMSFTEFSYQLVQGTDFLVLFQQHNCKLQMGGSDQWGNIITGTELIRRKLGHDAKAFALTCPLITKADGGKFGKTEEGNIWLDPAKTSPYSFYQFWLNTSDEDAISYIKIFTLLRKEEIDQLIENHRKAPHQRDLQKVLAREITIMIHSKEEYELAVDASEILFGKGTTDTLKRLKEDVLLNIFEGVPQSNVSSNDIYKSIPIVDFLTDFTKISSSKREAREFLRNGAISINKERVGENYMIGENDLLQNRYILAQRGKKNYYLIICDY